MRSLVRTLSVTLVAAVLAFGAPATGIADHAAIVRVDGATRVHTAAGLSQTLGGSPSDVDTVVIARADRYADALAGAPLAASLDGPLLLTGRDRLSDATADEIDRLGISTAIVLGGTAAVSQQVVDDLRSHDVDTVRRIGGADRFETAARVAAELDGAHVYVVEGIHADPSRGWPDAIAASGLAAHRVRPILLVEQDQLPPATRRFLRDQGTGSAIVIGGTAAVGDEVMAQIADPDDDGDTDVRVQRVSGSSRYETSVAVAQRSIDAGADPARLWLATGTNWPDGLAAGAAVGATGGVLLLVDGAQLSAAGASWSWIAEHAADTSTLGLVGGEAAIGPHIALAARQVVESGVPPRFGTFAAERARSFAADLADEIGPRPGGSSAETAAAQRLSDAFGAAGWTAVTETFPLPQGGTSRNVVAWLGAADPRGAPHVVIGGHIDTVEDSPGANDNASGVGAIVALAEELADEPTPVPVVLVGFGAEEFQPSEPRQHHIGSEAYAAAHADEVAGMVSVDMIAVGSPTCICWWRDGTSTGAARLDAVRAAAGLIGFEVEEGGDVSDHGPFARRGVPAALLSTPADSRYHTPDDTSEHLERETIRRSGDLTLALVRSLTADDRGGLRSSP